MRTAPFGLVPTEVVTAVLYGFSPRLVTYGVRAAREVTTPAAALEMMQTEVTALLTDLFDGLDAEVARAAELARQAALLHPIRSGMPGSRRCVTVGSSMGRVA